MTDLSRETEGESAPYVIVNGGVYHAGTLVYTMFQALAAEKAAREEAEARAVKAEREVIAERKQREWGEKFCAQRHVTKDGRSLR